MSENHYWFEWLQIRLLFDGYEVLPKKPNSYIESCIQAGSMDDPILVAKHADSYYVVNDQVIVAMYATVSQSPNALLYCKVVDYDASTFEHEQDLFPLQKRKKRRRAAQLKLQQRTRLMHELGLQGGCLYAKHREKIQRSCGYMRTGNVRHYVNTHPRRKTRSRDQYGAVFTPPKRDIMRIDRMNHQETDDKE